MGLKPPGTVNPCTDPLSNPGTNPGLIQGPKEAGPPISFLNRHFEGANPARHCISSLAPGQPADHPVCRGEGGATP